MDAAMAQTTHICLSRAETTCADWSKCDHFSGFQYSSYGSPKQSWFSSSCWRSRGPSFGAGCGSVVVVVVVKVVVVIIHAIVFICGDRRPLTSNSPRTTAFYEMRTLPHFF
eukprot:gnl/TRDRNA2_/TRDRNA2_73156_c0_seq1.p1 gnl/TRDRNA2_/TRDRNA2_73156_c0~~gnl/TRDRNA2_/TRDRNA2_73156_c0_seq1.p1  ORF type:complete len:111 (+),score=0.83 gnl/TRDRNA2_/TRDRNA2_73156_c0_seq1:71-403(+)